MAISSAVWGFLVGFVGWGVCFSLAEPVVERLLETKKSGGFSVGVARLLVTLFMIMAVLVTLGIVPAVIIAVMNDVSISHQVLWRKLYGFSFISSLIGLFTLGVLRKIK